MSFFLSTQGIRIEQEPASFAARLAAFGIDFLLMAVMWFVLIRVASVGLFDFLNKTLRIFLIFLIPFIYPLVSETTANGQTLGKYLLHIRVVSLDGGGPKVTSFILRCLFLPFDVLLSAGIGPLCVFFTKKQQRLGDLIAGTWVVRTQEYEKVDFLSLSAEK
jgi:uncharacterized RDD family membrane protein YckC